MPILQQAVLGDWNELEPRINDYIGYQLYLMAALKDPKIRNRCAGQLKGLNWMLLELGIIGPGLSIAFTCAVDAEYKRGVQ